MHELMWAHTNRKKKVKILEINCMLSWMFPVAITMTNIVWGIGKNLYVY
jgi:hypothetical protein